MISPKFTDRHCNDCRVPVGCSTISVDSSRVCGIQENFNGEVDANCNTQQSVAIVAEEVKDELPDCDVGDDLDHIVLKKRQRKLLTMRVQPVMEGSSMDLSTHGSSLLATVNVKVEPLNENDSHNIDNDVLSENSLYMQPLLSEPEIPEQLCEDILDHMRLRDRMKLLTAREIPGSTTTPENYKRSIDILPSCTHYSPIIPEATEPKTIKGSLNEKKTVIASDFAEAALKEIPPDLLEANFTETSEVAFEGCDERFREEVHLAVEESDEAKYHSIVIHNRDSSGLFATSAKSSQNSCARLPLNSFQQPLKASDFYTDSSVPNSSNDIKEHDPICSSRQASMELSGSALTLLTPVRVKAELLDIYDRQTMVKDVPPKAFDTHRVKSEPGILDQLNGDIVDHMRLRDRMQLLAAGKNPESETFLNSEFVRSVKASSPHYSQVFPDATKPKWINSSRKRKKTATDSVETALKEDAPALLQLLVEKGVSVDEIKLYGDTESDEILDESHSQSSLTDLAAVISKLFFQRSSLLKLAPRPSTEAGKPIYCLECLFSLVEETRYLQFRKWPAEWGWCRDLQSFIFVFERHNRIVLERPEYGFATYFFELINSLPLDWQINRLVVAMKLTNCGRINLLENKALMVGEDLSEGEAQVLVKCGWLPNTGLGTMLNYRDRVFHDRWNEKNRTEWRSKIGKLLMNGYNGGVLLTTTNSLKNVVESEHSEISPEVKLEVL